MSLFPDKRSNGYNRVPYSSINSELIQSLIKSSPELIISDNLEKVQMLTSVGKNAFYTREIFPVLSSLKSKKVNLVGDGPDIQVIKQYLEGQPINGDGYYNYSLLGDRLGIVLTGIKSNLSTPEDVFAAEAILRYPLAQILYQAFQVLDPQIESLQAIWLLLSLSAVLSFLECNLVTPFVKEPNKRFMGQNDIETIINVFWELHRGKNVEQTFDQGFHTEFHLYINDLCQRYSLNHSKIKRWLEKQRTVETFLLGQFSGSKPVIFHQYIPSEDLQPVFAEGVIYWINRYAQTSRLINSDPLTYETNPVTISHLLDLKPLVIKSIILDETTLWYKLNFDTF